MPVHPSMLPDLAVPITADGKPAPKYARVAAAVKSQIDDGTLRPGQAAPSGAALSRVTGFSTLTCRRALRVLIADGVLLPGPSRNARPRVAGAPQRPGERDLAAAARALSAALAALRRASGLTQPGLAAVVGVSVTTIGHAETGRLWQSRHFWNRADAVLGAGGDLLRLHEAYGEASASSPAEPPASAGPVDAGTDVMTADDTPGTAAAEAPGTAADDTVGGEPEANWCGTARAAGPGACPAGGPHPASPDAPERARPAWVMIMWGDGTVTTVHPPGTPPPQAAPAETPPAEKSPGHDGQ